MRIGKEYVSIPLHDDFQKWNMRVEKEIVNRIDINNRYI